MIGLVLVSMALAGHPADLAPGAPDLQDSEQRLVALIAEADAVRAATSRLQARWVALGHPPADVDGTGKTVVPRAKPVDPCAQERTDIGWRIERFGSAWREAAQAVHAEAGRLAGIRSAATVAPLVDARWGDRLNGLVAADTAGEKAFVEASVWQATFVRPVLDTCASAPVKAAPARKPKVKPDSQAETPDARVDEPAAPPPNGEALTFAWEKGHVATPVAVLAAGDGWVCPAGIRADDAVVLLDPGADGSANACWSASSTCGCAGEAVWPGGVIAPPAD